MKSSSEVKQDPRFLELSVFLIISLKEELDNSLEIC